jgi:uncharacterized protein (DUF169 family)
MGNHAEIEQVLTGALGLTRRPVAVAFVDTPPPGVARLEGAQPSGCSFWRLVAGGRTFYTLPADHYNCPVGAYTHNIPLPPEREQELIQTLSLMTGVGYIRMEEVPGVPRLARTPAVTVYAPLGATPVEPDAVLVAGTPGRLMLLHEAGIRAGRAAAPMLGRPTCMAIPVAMSGSVASSLGCIGNRIYTGITDDEFYTVVKGRDLPSIVGQLATIGAANAALADYHRGRNATLSAI